MKPIQLVHRVWLLAALASGACTAGAELPVAEAEGALRSRAPRLIQPGEDLMLIAVTEDDHAVYQEGQTVYASRLEPGAERTFVADVPAGNIAFPLQLGKVVFLWTAPERHLPGFGVSPLVLWTAARGPQLISDSSAVGLVATSLSPDGREILFTTRVARDGLRGDLVHARTREPQATTTLLADLPLDFPSGRCRPLAGFATDGHDAFPIAAYCAPGETTATLSTWERGRRRDLIDGLATPLRFFFGKNPQSDTYLVSLADGTVATVTTSGHVKVIDHTTLGSAGFITRRGTVGYIATGAPPAELRLALRGRVPPVVVGPALPNPATPVELVNRSGYSTRQTTSLDGKLALFTTVRDPATGLMDMNLADLTSGDATVLESRPATFWGSELFTADSRYALYFDLSVAGFGALIAGNEHGSRQVGSSLNVWDVFRAAGGSEISYSDNPVLSGDRAGYASTADLVVTDVDDPSRAPRVVTEQAFYDYFPSHDRTRITFTTPHEAQGPGLYVASARP